MKARRDPLRYEVDDDDDDKVVVDDDDNDIDNDDETAARLYPYRGCSPA